MGWGNAIGKIGKAWNKWRENRRGRIRTQILALKEKKKQIMSSPPNKSKVKRIEAIIKKIYKLQSILNQE